MRKSHFFFSKKEKSGVAAAYLYVFTSWLSFSILVRESQILVKIFGCT